MELEVVECGGGGKMWSRKLWTVEKVVELEVVECGGEGQRGSMGISRHVGSPTAVGRSSNSSCLAEQGVRPQHGVAFCSMVLRRRAAMSKQIVQTTKKKKGTTVPASKLSKRASKRNFRCFLMA